jgi:hypothetical protein
MVSVTQENEFNWRLHALQWYGTMEKVLGRLLAVGGLFYLFLKWLWKPQPNRS